MAGWGGSVETVVLTQADIWLLVAIMFGPMHLVLTATLICMRYQYSKKWKQWEKENQELTRSF